MKRHNGRRPNLARIPLQQLRSPLDLRPMRPPQDPLEAYVEELARIIKKARAGLVAQGVNNVGPPFPRGFVGPF